MDLKTHEKLFDIEWFDGPMMSLFTNKKGELFIYSWVEANSEYHTWLVFQTSHSHLSLYIQQVISEKALILLAQHEIWYLVDINPSIEFSNMKKVSAEVLRQTVLPKSSTFFRMENCIEPEKLKPFASKDLVTT